MPSIVEAFYPMWETAELTATSSELRQHQGLTPREVGTVSHRGGNRSWDKACKARTTTEGRCWGGSGSQPVQKTTWDNGFVLLGGHTTTSFQGPRFDATIVPKCTAAAAAAAAAVSFAAATPQAWTLTVSDALNAYGSAVSAVVPVLPRAAHSSMICQPCLREFFATRRSWFDGIISRIQGRSPPS